MYVEHVSTGRRDSSAGSTKQTSEALLVSDGRLRAAVWGLNQTSFVSPPPLLAEHRRGGSGRFVVLCKAGVPSLLPVFVRPSEASTCLISGSRPEISSLCELESLVGRTRQKHPIILLFALAALSVGGSEQKQVCVPSPSRGLWRPERDVDDLVCSQK